MPLSTADGNTVRRLRLQLDFEVVGLMEKGLRRQTAVALVAERYDMEPADIDNVTWASMLRRHGLTLPSDVPATHTGLT